MNEHVSGYLITWTVYGTHLQGDERWWKKRDNGTMPPQPILLQWQRNQLNYSVQLLTELERFIVEQAIKNHCDYREWKEWASNARSNHIHTVITANGVDGKKAREQLKANCTRELREKFERWRDRPVWSVGGHCERLTTEEDLEHAIEYVLYSQDRKHLDHQPKGASPG